MLKRAGRCGDGGTNVELNTSFLIRTFFLAFKGVPAALFITGTALLLSAMPSFFMALARIYRIRFFSSAVRLYISFIRGTPMMVQILLVYSLLPSFINMLLKACHSSYNVFDLPPMIYAVTAFTLHNTAGMAELLRAAILTVSREQMDASSALGFNKMQAFRYVILPQAAVSAVPNLCNLTVDLFKETSLAFLMTVKDITAIAKIEAAYGYNYIEAYLDIFFIYIIVCSAIQLIFLVVERRLCTNR